MCVYIYKCVCVYIHKEIYYVKLCLQALWNLYLFCTSHTVGENAAQKTKSMP